VDQGSAAIMTWMLKNVVQAGTGRAAQLDRAVAGKTGTSDKSRDLWFIGYIPQPLVFGSATTTTIPPRAVVAPQLTPGKMV